MTTYTININLQHCTNCGADHTSILSASVGPNRNLFLAPIAGNPAEVIHNTTQSLLPFCPTCMPETLDTETEHLHFAQEIQPRVFLPNARNIPTRTYTIEDL